MTATAADVERVARAEVGYVETGGAGGHSGNVTKYWAELDPSFQGQPWCAAFQRWVDKHAGAPLLPASNPYYCPNLKTYARHASLWDTSGRYAKGDLVLFAFTSSAQSSGLAQHVERVLADDGTTITTVGGNTSPDERGSQTNGGGVYVRHRRHGPSVLGAIKTSRLLAKPTAPPPAAPPPPRRKPNPYAVPVFDAAHRPFGRGASSDRATGSTRVHFTQWAVGVPCDGIFGDHTYEGVVEFQRYHKDPSSDRPLAVDGIVGSATVRAMRLITH